MQGGTTQSVWESRELPVLDAVVRYFDEHIGEAGPTVGDIANITNMDVRDVFRAVQALQPTYLTLRMYLSGGRLEPHRILSVTDAARREVGQWGRRMIDQIPLQQEQRDLLTALVEASRNVPRDQREEFIYVRTLGSSDVQHPGLPGWQLPVYQGDLDVLAAEALLNVTAPQRGVLMFDVAPRGFELYEELRQHATTPARQVEEHLMRYLDSDAFQRSYPEAHRKWAEAAERLWASDSQQQLTMIGHLCREAMQEFATSLVDHHQPPGVNTDKAHDVARIRAVLDQQTSKLGTTAAPFLKALLGYWGTVSDLVQRQEHGAQKEGRPLVWEDGRRVVFQTAVVMFEIDRTLS